MSDEAAPARKATAMEVARDAAEQIGELRAEVGEVRTTLREMREGGAVAAPAGDGAALATIAAKVETLDGDIEGMTANLNTLAQQLARIAPAEGQVIARDLIKLDEKVANSFTAFSQRVDAHNNATQAALSEINTQISGLPRLRQKVAELVEQVGVFAESGAAPASAEDVSSLDSRVRGIEQALTATASSEDLNEVHQRISSLRGDVGELRAGLADDQAMSPRGRQVPAIYGQVHELMKRVTELGKDRKADAKMGGYAFRSIDSAMDAVGRALREVGVMFQPRRITDKRVERYEVVSKDGFRQNWTHVWVTQEYVFVSLVDGSEMPAVEMDGEGRDNGDKSTSKADSMRFKYALLQALCIPVNGLPESDGRDGTEGGDFAPAYGRGGAGEAFDNATPVRPQQDAPRQQTPYGHGHQPPESPGGQAHAQAVAQQAQAEQPEDTRTPAQKALAAREALASVLTLRPSAQRDRYTAITNAIADQKLGTHEVLDDAGQVVTLNRYAALVNAQVGVG